MYMHHIQLIINVQILNVTKISFSSHTIHYCSGTTIHRICKLFLDSSVFVYKDRFPCHSTCRHNRFDKFLLPPVLSSTVQRQKLNKVQLVHPCYCNISYISVLFWTHCIFFSHIDMLRWRLFNLWNSWSMSYSCVYHCRLILCKWYFPTSAILSIDKYIWYQR